MTHTKTSQYSLYFGLSADLRTEIGDLYDPDNHQFMVAWNDCHETHEWACETYRTKQEMVEKVEEFKSL